MKRTVSANLDTLTTNGWQCRWDDESSFYLSPCTQKHCNSALGLKWKQVQKPAQGHEIRNEALAAKLQHQQLQLTKKRMDFFVYCVHSV